MCITCCCPAAAESYHWGSEHWTAALWKKVHLAHTLLELGYNVVFSDLDATWLRDPLPYFAKWHERMPYMTSVDNLHTVNKDGDDGPEQDPNAFSGFNTGGGLG
jgi:hypothetical protein